jgi:hypothetical protein
MIQVGSIERRRDTVETDLKRVLDHLHPCHRSLRRAFPYRDQGKTQNQEKTAQRERSRVLLQQRNHTINMLAPTQRVRLRKRSPRGTREGRVEPILPRQIPPGRLKRKHRLMRQGKRLG